MAKRNLIVLFAYLILALVLTYPLVMQYADHVPGTTTWSMDEYGYVWNNWWFKHAVFDLQTNPFQTNQILYPVGTSLVLYTFTLLHVLLGLPIQFALGLIPASNAELLFAFVMNGFGAFLLIKYLLRVSGFKYHPGQPETWDLKLETLSAFIGGALFAFSSNRFVYASLGHYNVVATEWIPFYVLFLVKTVREPRWKNALLAGLFLAFALYVEMTQGVLLALFTALYLLISWRELRSRAVIARLAAMSATAALLFALLLVPTLNEILNSGYTLPGWGHAEKLLVDLFGFLTPTSLHPLNRNWTQELGLVRQGASRFADVNTVFVGYATLALALVAVLRFWKPLKVWVLSAIAFAVLSLGPLLHINGVSEFNFDGLSATFPMPFLLLHYIPLLKENRAPNRFSVLLMLSLAVLAAFSIAWLLEKISSRQKTVSSKFALPATFCFLLAVLLFEHSAVPLPLTDARIPSVYAQIAREPGDFAVLTLPLGWRNSFGQLGVEDTRVQYYQSAHGKNIFPANIQRNPPFLFDYFDRIPIFHSLAQLEALDSISDEDLARDKSLASMLMTLFDVRFVVIHPSISGRPPYDESRRAVIDYVQAVLPLGEKVFDAEGVLAYQIQQTPLPSKQQIDFGTLAAQPFQAEGWDRSEVLGGESANWANRREARVMFPLRELVDYQITLRALPFAPAQTMELIVNGTSIQRFDLKSGWQNYSATIPARALRYGLNDLVLKFAHVTKPRDVLPANYAIGGTGVVSPVDIVVSSGTRASIKVNGREESKLARGYNVVVIDAKTGSVTDSRLFNTADDRAQSRAMTDFLRQIPNGRIVVVAAQENGGVQLGDRTVAALQTLGAQIDLRPTPNRSHAIIGVKGATPGSAIEQSDDGDVMISVGRNVDERTLAAAVSVITIERK